MSTILVPLDGSDLAGAAIGLAARLALGTGRALELIEAIELLVADTPAGTIEALERGASETLEETATGVQKEYGLSPTSAVRYGSPARVILDEIVTQDASLVVMSSHGRTGVLRLLLGSVAEEVLRRAPVPVVFVPSRAAEAAASPLRRILVPLDGSALSQSGIGPVAALAGRLRAEAVVCRVYAPIAAEQTKPGQDRGVHDAAIQAEKYLSPIVADLRRKGVEVTAEYRQTADIAAAVLDIAAAVRADVIALATHGRSGLDRLQHGSVAEVILRRRPVPLITFGPQALQRLTNAAAAEVS